MILQNVPQVDGVGKADRTPRGLPGKPFAPLDASDGSFYVFDPKFSLLHVRRLKEMIVFLVRSYLEHQLKEEWLASDIASPSENGVCVHLSCVINQVDAAAALLVIEVNKPFACSHHWGS